MNIPVRNNTQRGGLSDPRPDRIEPDDLLQLLRRNLPLIALIIAAVIGLTALYLARQQNIYTAQAEMALTNSELRLSKIDSQFESYELNNSRVSTELDVLRSRNFADRVATDLGLFTDAGFLPPAEPPAPARSPEEHNRAVIDKLLDAYSLHRTGESLVITVQARSESADLAARIANGIVAGFIELSVKNQSEVIDSSIIYLRGQVDSLGEELSLKEVDLADFIREHALDDTEEPARLRRERSHMVSVLEVMQSESQGDTADARRIRGQLAELEAQLAERTRNDLTLSRKQRYIDLLSARYQTAIERLNELEPRKQMIQPDARQVSFAEVPIEPAWPNRRATLALAGAAGLAIAFVVALMKEAMNRKIWDGQQATRISDLPNLGSLPRIRRKGWLSRDHDPVWFLKTFPRSAFAEALRSLFTIWSSQKHDRDGTRLVMITSALAGEGKSTVATGLATSAAQDGLRVLLMDFDTHRGGASQILRLQPSNITADSFVEGGTVARAAQVPVDGVEGLFAVSFSTSTHWTPGLVRKFGEKALPELRESYDLIVIDTPPALAVADAVRFSSFVDEALIVLRSGKTGERALRNTVDRLLGCGVNVAGTVVNAVEPRRYRQQNQGEGYGYY